MVRPTPRAAVVALLRVDGTESLATQEWLPGELSLPRSRSESAHARPVLFVWRPPLQHVQVAPAKPPVWARTFLRNCFNCSVAVLARGECDRGLKLGLAFARLRNRLQGGAAEDSQSLCRQNCLGAKSFCQVGIVLWLQCRPWEDPKTEPDQRVSFPSSVGSASPTSVH